MKIEIVVTISGAQLVRVRRVRPHPLKFGNGCAAPVLRMTKIELEGYFWGLKSNISQLESDRQPNFFLKSDLK